MSVKNSVSPITLTSFDSANLTANYQLLTGAMGIPHPLFYLKIINSSTLVVTVSYDGVNDHDVIFGQTTQSINFQTNNQPTNQNALLPQGTKVYVKGNAGVGLIYLSGWFQPQGV